MYDIFYITDLDNDPKWKTIKDRYPRAQRLKNVSSFDDLKNKAFTKMFWVIWNDVILNPDFDLDSYKATKWDDMYVHIFKNGEFKDGICLFPKSLSVTSKEFKNRFFIDKKEIDVEASRPEPYEKFIIGSYDDYLEAVKKSKYEMFWGIWKEIEIIDDKIFDLYFSHHNLYDRSENHMFKHIFKNEETFINGVTLFSTNKIVTKKEIDFRFMIEKKEHEHTVSKLKPYDIVFVSYNEPNADENYEKLKSRFPRASRVHGIKGIHQAHIKAAETAETEMFWVVDADAVIEDGFNFDYEVSRYDLDAVFVWQSKNPINDLVYGYGGVKLFPRELTLGMKTDSVDMTMSISKKFKNINSVSNTTAFNYDEFSTWKSAFRECVKLASSIINPDYDDETDSRLDIWCSVGDDRHLGKFAIDGAKMGRDFGFEYIDDKTNLSKINDFEWLRETYEKYLSAQGT